MNGEGQGDIATRSTTRRDELRQKAVTIYRHFIRGLSPTEIAEVEGIPERTVYWYLKEGGRIFGDQLRTVTQAGLLRLMFFHHHERQRELWLVFGSTRQDAVKVACLAKLAEEDDRLIDLAERMGLSLDPATSSEETIRAVVDFFEGVLTEEERHRLAETVRRRMRGEETRNGGSNGQPRYPATPCLPTSQSAETP